MTTAPTATYAEQPAIVALYDDGRVSEATIVIDAQPRTYFLAFKVKGLRGSMYLCTRREPQAPRRFYQLDVALRWVQERLPGIERIQLLTTGPASGTPQPARRR